MTLCIIICRYWGVQCALCHCVVEYHIVHVICVLPVSFELCSDFLNYILQSSCPFIIKLVIIDCSKQGGSPTIDNFCDKPNPLCLFCSESAAKQKYLQKAKVPSSKSTSKQKYLQKSKWKTNQLYSIMHD